MTTLLPYFEFTLPHYKCIMCKIAVVWTDKQLILRKGLVTLDLYHQCHIQNYRADLSQISSYSVKEKCELIKFPSTTCWLVKINSWWWQFSKRMGATRLSR